MCPRCRPQTEGEMNQGEVKALSLHARMENASRMHRMVSIIISSKKTSTYASRKQPQSPHYLVY